MAGWRSIVGGCYNNNQTLSLSQCKAKQRHGRRWCTDPCTEADTGGGGNACACLYLKVVGWLFGGWPAARWLVRLPLVVMWGLCYPGRHVYRQRSILSVGGIAGWMAGWMDGQPRDLLGLPIRHIL